MARTSGSFTNPQVEPSSPTTRNPFGSLPLPTPSRSDKGIISNRSLGIQVEFMANPEQLEDSKSIEYTTKPIFGLHEPLIAFYHGGEHKLKFELLLDANISGKPHIGDELDQINLLVTTFNSRGSPTVNLPFYGSMSGSLDAVRVLGFTPLCKFYYGGIVRDVLVANRVITEMLHVPLQTGGAAPNSFLRGLANEAQGKANQAGVQGLVNLVNPKAAGGTTPLPNKPTRAKVTLDLIVVENIQNTLLWRHF